MAFATFTPVLRNLRRRIARAGGPAVSDRQLLERFVSFRDEAAFELLVWRHGPMLLGVCRRLLRDPHDAEDAFQATLLVLARKAHSIGRGSLGGWLYQVAYRIALRSLAQARRRRRVETGMAALGSVADTHDVPDPVHEELRSALDRELNALPEKYRVPVVLCYLQGLTNEETARHLGCPPGTVKTRLRHARRLLGNRLARRGFTFAATLVATGTLPNVLSATMPMALASRTASAAVLFVLGKATSANVSASVVRLTNGVLQTMFMMKLKWSAAVLAMAMAVAGIIGFGVYGPSAIAPAAAAGDHKATPPVTPVDAAARAQQLRKQIAQLQEELRRTEGAAQNKPAGKDKVAVIFDDISLTRDQFAEYLLARARDEQLAAFINQRILAHACQVHGITVSDAEVETAFAKDMEPFKGPVPLKDTLARFGKTPDEWKQDVIRPRLLITKLCRPRIVVTEQHLRDAFDDAHGEKVACQLILWPKERKHEAERHAAVLRHDVEAFDDAAAHQATPSLAIMKGKVPPLSRHSHGSEGIAAAAFRLQPGEVSALIDVPEGFALVRFLRRIPADSTKKLEEVRDSLRQKVFDDLLKAEIPRAFQELKQRAHPEVLWRAGLPQQPAG
jgi:RNA polymerase sigma factor (sigma-70 family)